MVSTSLTCSGSSKGLLPHVDCAASYIDVGVADRADHLRQRNVVGVELMQIDLDVVFLGRAAPGIHLHDPGNSQEASLQYPILDGAEIGQTEVWRSDHLISVDFADQTASLD